jgi:hypothetical protein
MPSEFGGGKADYLIDIQVSAYNSLGRTPREYCYYTTKKGERVVVAVILTLELSEGQKRDEERISSATFHLES